MMQRSLRYLCLALIVFSGAGCNDKKQKPETAIRGTVVTQTGVPLEGAAVLLDGTTFQTVTNKQGKFTISGFPYGTYTVDAFKAGYLPAAEFNIEMTKERKSAETRIIAKPDPDYVPDSLRIVGITPSPESVLTPGHDVSVKFRVEYTLSSDAYASIAVSYQDDRGNALMPMPSQQTVTARKGFVPFGQTIRVPARMNGKVYVIAALFSGSASESKVAERVTYYVRPIPDQIKVSEMGLTAGSLWGTGKEVSVTATIDYLMKSFSRAEVRMQVRGDLGNDRFEVLLHQEAHKIDRTKSEKGTLTYQPRFTIPANVTAVRIKATMTPEEMKEPVVIQWSKPCSTDRSPSEGG